MVSVQPLLNYCIDFLVVIKSLKFVSPINLSIVGQIEAINLAQESSILLKVAYKWFT